MNPRRFLPLFLLLPALAAADTLTYNGCRYEGSVRQQKPHGQGMLTCPDGTAYQGQFANGQFHGKGSFSVPASGSVLLPAFGLRSVYVRGMTLQGQFRHGRANGRLAVTQNGEHNIDIIFADGVMKEVVTAKKKKQPAR